jgi:hypothetical protein
LVICDTAIDKNIRHHIHCFSPALIQSRVVEEPIAQLFRQQKSALPTPVRVVTATFFFCEGMPNQSLL